MTDSRIAALRQTHLAALVTLTIDYIVNQPIRNLIEPSFVVNQLQLGLAAAVEGDTTERWVRDRIAELRENTPSGTPGDWMPHEIKSPIRDVLKREIQVDRQLVRQLIDHTAVEQLFNDILTDTLTDFVETLKGLSASTTPNSVSKGFGRLKSLRDKAMTATPLGSITQMLEQSAQRKIREQVDAAIVACLDRAADHLTQPAHQTLQAQWRAHMFDVVLNTNNTVFAAQVDALDPDSLVEAITAIVRIFIQTEDFNDLLNSGVEMGFESLGEKSIFTILTEAGLDYDWRSETEQQITEIGLGVINSPEFSRWLFDWLGEAAPESES